jgi:hypothetical protein
VVADNDRVVVREWNADLNQQGSRLGTVNSASDGPSGQVVIDFDTEGYGVYRQDDVNLGRLDGGPFRFGLNNGREI